jgi:hypothetical protein
MGTVIMLLLSGCSSTFSGNLSQTRKHHESYSTAPDIPQAKVRPYAYSGTLKRYEPSIWLLPFLRPNYDYCIADEKGNTVAFLDISDLAMGTSLASLMGKTVTVSGQTAPHKYRGVIIIKAKHIIAMTH